MEKHHGQALLSPFNPAIGELRPRSSRQGYCRCHQVTSLQISYHAKSKTYNLIQFLGRRKRGRKRYLIPVASLVQSPPSILNCFCPQSHFSQRNSSSTHDKQICLAITTKFHKMPAQIPVSLKKSVEESKAEYVQLGKSGLRVSVPIFGTMSLGSSEWADWVINEEEASSQFPFSLQASLDLYLSFNLILLMPNYSGV